MTHRTKVDMAGLGRDGGESCARLDQPGHAQARSRSENDLRPRHPEIERPNAARPIGRNRRERQGLRLEVVEQQPLSKASAPRGFGPVHHPGRVGEFEGPAHDRPRPAGDHRAGALAELRRGRLNRLGQPGIVLGGKVDDRPEWPARFTSKREAHIGATRVADENRKGKARVAHDLAINANAQGRGQVGWKTTDCNRISTGIRNK
jgi:hypothetical protein